MPYNLKGDVNIQRNLYLGSLTTAQRTSLTPTKDGSIVYDTDLDAVFSYSGGSWKQMLDATLSDGQILIGNGSNEATSVTMSGDAEISNTGVINVKSKIKDWTGSTAVQEGELRLATISGVNVTMRSDSDRTTNASLNNSELGNWSYVSQEKVGSFSSLTYYLEGHKILSDGNLYEKASNGTSSLALITSNWNLIASGSGAAEFWTPSTDVKEGELKLVTLGSVRVLIASTGDRTTGASFDATELLSWRYMSQENLAGYSASTLYIDGQQVIVDGSLYEKSGSGISAATFDDLQWILYIRGYTLTREWTGTTNYKENEIVKFTHPNSSTIYLRAISNHTSEASMNATEVPRWSIVTQDKIEGWSANAPRWEGMEISSAGMILKALNTGLNDPFYSGPTTTHYEVVSQTGRTGWSGSTAFFGNQIIAISIGGFVAEFKSTSSRTSSVSLTVSEFSEWELYRQPNIPIWQGGIIYPENYKVYYQGSLLQRNTLGSSQATFNGVEKAQWTYLAEGFKENGLLTGNVTDNGAGSYKLYAPTVDCILQLRDLSSASDEGVRIVTNWGGGNGVIIRPASGEAINGVVDQDFNLDNYPVGTQVMIISESASSWSVKIIGQAGEEDGLSFKHFSWVNQAGTSGSPFNFTTRSSRDSQNKITHVANSGTITLNKGRYIVNVSLTFKTAGTGSATINITDGSIPDRDFVIELDQLYIQGSGQPNNAHDRTRMFTLEVLEDGHEFNIERVASSGNGNTDGEIMVIEVPSSDSITAGQVKATKIGHAHFKQTTRQVNANNGVLYNFAENELTNTSNGNIIKINDTSVTLKAGVRYKITTKVAVNNSGTSQANVKILIDGLDILPGDNESGLSFAMGSNSSYSEAGNVVHFLDESVSDRILTLTGNNNTTGADIVIPNTVIEILPSHSAIIPEGVEVRELGRATISWTGNSGTFTSTSTAPIGTNSSFSTNSGRFSFNSDTHLLTITAGSRVRISTNGGKPFASSGYAIYHWATTGSSAVYKPVGAIAKYGVQMAANVTGIAESSHDCYLEFTPTTTVTLRLYVSFTSNFLFSADTSAITIEEIPEYNIIQSDFIEEFSTTETITNKRWIDGRPIYRKVIQFADFTTGAGQNVSTGITGVTSNARLIHAYGAGNEQSEGDDWYSIPNGNGGSNNDVDIKVANDLSLVRVDQGSGINFGTEAYVVLEYVK